MKSKSAFERRQKETLGKRDGIHIGSVFLTRIKNNKSRTFLVNKNYFPLSLLKYDKIFFKNIMYSMVYNPFKSEI